MKMVSKDAVGGRETDSPIHNSSISLPNTASKSHTTGLTEIATACTFVIPLAKQTPAIMGCHALLSGVSETLGLENKFNHQYW